MDFCFTPNLKLIGPLSDCREGLFEDDSLYCIAILHLFIGIHTALIQRNQRGKSLTIRSKTDCIEVPGCSYPPSDPWSMSLLLFIFSMRIP